MTEMQKEIIKVGDVVFVNAFENLKVENSTSKLQFCRAFCVL